MNRMLPGTLTVLVLTLPLMAQETPAPTKETPRPKLTTDFGTPVGDNQNSQTAGPNGPTLLQDMTLVEKLARFDRERIPERVVHARGAGAGGVFESYGNYGEFTRAAFLNTKGKKTEVFVRFSTVIHPSGSPETARDPRGFSVKFYTEEGNYDMVGNHIPVFFIRDAIKFPDVIHSLKPSPVTNKQEPNRYYDFLSRTPEATHMTTWLLSDHGTPANFREIDGFSIHAFKFVNEKGDVKYVKFHWKSMQGVRTLDTKQVAAIQAQDWGHATGDLYDSIAAKKFPSWELQVQMIDPKQLDTFDFNPLDATKVWPEALVPSVAIGKMTLNRAPKNFFAEVEQVAFSPGVLVPGIEPSEDRLLQGRLFSYGDTQRHRLGANYLQLPVNLPRAEVNNYNQNGPATAVRQPDGEFNYEPNAGTNTPVEQKRARPSYLALFGFTQQAKIKKTLDFQQAGETYREFSPEMRTNLVANLVADLKKVERPEVVQKMVGYFYLADKEYGSRVASGLGIDIEAVKASVAQR